MTPHYLSFIISHGTLACSIREVAEKLIKPATKIYCYSNQISVLEEIEREISQRIEEEKPEKIVLFVDLAGGSCWISANRIKRDSENISVIGGVNVPMLISYFTNYDRLDWPELITKITSDGQKGILVR